MKQNLTVLGLFLCISYAKANEDLDMDNATLAEI
jgi:hypothetical protein